MVFKISSTNTKFFKAAPKKQYTSKKRGTKLNFQHDFDFFPPPELIISRFQTIADTKDSPF